MFKFFPAEGDRIKGSTFTLCVPIFAPLISGILCRAYKCLEENIFELIMATLNRKEKRKIVLNVELYQFKLLIDAFR